MQNFFQIATGNSVREEVIDYVVAKDLKSIEEGVRTAFLNEFDYLGDYKKFELGNQNNFGQVPLIVTYIDVYGDEETTEWQLRTVKAFF